MEATPFAASIECYEVGKPDDILRLTKVMNDLAQLVADRNPDFYECVDGRLVRSD